MVTGYFSKDQRDQVVELMDKLKISMLEAIDRGQVLRISQEIEAEPVSSECYGEPIAHVYTGNFRWTIGTRGFRGNREIRYE